jgi:hypothetical protein
MVVCVVCGLGGCSGAEPGAKPAARTNAAEPAPVSEGAAPSGAPATPPPAPSPSGAEAATSEPAPNATATPTPAADPASPATDAALAAAAPPAGPTEPLQASVEQAVTLPDGVVLRVAAEEGFDQSVVWAQTITPPGPPGPVVVLRKTSGAVDAIAADFDGQTLWVAWRSDLGEGKKSMLALAGFDRHLALTRPPRILRSFDHNGSPMQTPLRVIPRPGTAAGVTVVAAVGVAPCRGLHHDREEGPASCQRLEVDVIDPDGTTRRTAFRMLDGGDGGITGALAVDAGVVTSFFVWHGGPLLDVAFVPYDPGEPVRALAPCGYPPVELAWVDGAVLMVCPDPSGETKCDGRASSPCGTLRRTTLDGKPLAPDAGKEVRFHRATQGCKDGRPALRLSWVADPEEPAIAPGHLDVPGHSLGPWGALGPSPSGPCRGPALE